MSCSWNLICLDCNDEHREFNSTNHRDDLMISLVKHAAALAALAPLVSDQGDVYIDTSCGSVDIAWFAKHRGHKIWPKDEYGDLLKDCPNRVTCSGCGSRHRRCCKQAGHEGPCDPKRDMDEAKLRAAPETR